MKIIDARVFDYRSIGYGNSPDLQIVVDKYPEAYARQEVIEDEAGKNIWVFNHYPVLSKINEIEDFELVWFAVFPIKDLDVPHRQFMGALSANLDPEVYGTTEFTWMDETKQIPFRLDNGWSSRAGQVNKLDLLPHHVTEVTVYDNPEYKCGRMFYIPTSVAERLVVEQGWGMVKYENSSSDIAYEYKCCESWNGKTCKAAFLPCDSCPYTNIPDAVQDETFLLEPGNLMDYPEEEAPIDLDAQ